MEMRFRLLALSAAVAVLAAGCGGSSTPTTTKSQSSHKSGGSQKQSSSGSGMSTTGSSGSSSAVSSSGTPTFASASNCMQLAGVSEQFGKAMAAATSGGKFDLNAAVKAYQNLADAAPSAIRPDIQTLASAFTAYASALSKSGYTLGQVPTPSQITQIEQAAKVFNEAKLRTAAKDVEAWASSNCG